MAGSSNDSIVRRLVPSVFELLKKYKGDDIFVIVGWTSPERKDFFTENNWETLYPAHNHRQYSRKCKQIVGCVCKTFLERGRIYKSLYTYKFIYTLFFKKS